MLSPYLLKSKTPYVESFAEILLSFLTKSVPIGSQGISYSFFKIHSLILHILESLCTGDVNVAGFHRLDLIMGHFLCKLFVALHSLQIVCCPPKS